MRDEFTNQGMRDASESRWPDPRRRQIYKKLFEVPAVVQNGMRRGILYGLKVFEILRNRGFHSLLQLRGRGPHTVSATAILRKAKSRPVVSLDASRSGFGRHGDRSFFRLRLRLCFRHNLLPITPFVEAGVHGADLGAFFDDERRATLRARLGNGHVRRGEIAIRITGATIEDARAASAALTGAAAAHEFTFIAFWTFDAQGDRARVLAFRVAGAADEFAEAAVFFHQPIAAERAFFIERLIRLMCDARALDEAARGPAVREAGAGEKGAEAATLDGHLLAAIVAIFGFGFAAGLFGSLRRKVLDEIAIGIARAAEEETVAADALEQFALAALFALFPRGNASFVGKHLVVGFIEVNGEFFPKLFDRFTPRQLAFFDLVEFFFEPRRKRDVENVLETLDQQHADALAEHGGRETSLVLGDVLALDKR